MGDIKDKILAAPVATTITDAVLLGVQAATKKQFPGALFAPASHAHTFDSLTSKPTSLGGYGITDALPSSYLDTDGTLAANSDTKIASQKAVATFVAARVAALVNSAPSTLDTLAEIATALGNDPSLATTLTTSIGTKLAKSANLSDLTSAATARSNLGLVIGTDVLSPTGNISGTTGINLDIAAELNLRAPLDSPAFTTSATLDGAQIATLDDVLTGLEIGVTAIASGSGGGPLVNIGGLLQQVTQGDGVLIGDGADGYSFGLIGDSEVDSISGTKITGLAASAFLDATNASNITSGSLSLSRLGGLGTGVSTALGNAVNAASGFLTYSIIGTSGATVPLLNAGNTFSAAQAITLISLGTTPSAALSLINSTAAANGAQQVSGSLVWTGQGWKTAATAASQSVNYRAYVLPIQGAATPTSCWRLDYDNGTGSYTQGITFTPGTTPTLSLGGTGAMGGFTLAVDYNTTSLTVAANTITHTSGGVQSFRLADQYVTNPGLTLGSDAGTSALAISTAASSTARTNANSVTWFRAASATWQTGIDHATTATDQTIKAHNVTTGTGADLILKGGTGSVANGRVRFGTHSAIAAETITGYITIKDEGGTLRKLAVVS